MDQGNTDTNQSPKTLKPSSTGEEGVENPPETPDTAPWPEQNPPDEVPARRETPQSIPEKA